MVILWPDCGCIVTRLWPCGHIVTISWPYSGCFEAYCGQIENIANLAMSRKQIPQFIAVWLQLVINAYNFFFPISYFLPKLPKLGTEEIIGEFDIIVPGCPSS